MDIRVNDEYVKVTNKDGSLALARFFKSARIETGGTVERGKLSDITVKGLPEIPAKGEMVEKDQLYNVNGKSLHCIKDALVTDNIIEDKTILRNVEDIDNITKPVIK
jgi:hypothetical protein